MPALSQIQLGKQGVTDNFLKTLKERFTNCSTIKISVLRSTSREKKDLINYSTQMLDYLGNNYTSKILGFTVIIKKWRRPKQ